MRAALILLLLAAARAEAGTVEIRSMTRILSSFFASDLADPFVVVAPPAHRHHRRNGVCCWNARIVPAKILRSIATAHQAVRASFADQPLPTLLFGIS
jgi:hypothetical protein